MEQADRRRTILALLAIAALVGCARPRPLSLKRVVLYQNGIGYYERQGTFVGQRFRLRLRAHELNDVLKTLTVIDRSDKDRRGPVTAVVPKQKPAETDKQESGDQPVWLDIALGHAGRHDLLIAYSAPTPTWKATYRLVLPETDSGQALLQGWALVNNASGEDWARIRLTLATGAPMTFAMDMQSPHFVARPDLSGQMVQPVTTGKVLAERARPGDRDGDGIADATDTCPDAAEDRDGFKDDDGCPEPDNDGDGILDATDKCPNEPEAYNGMQDDDGCPDKAHVMVQAAQLEILDKIYFGKGSDAIKAVSRPLLAAIAATLKGNPDIRVVEVQGHASRVEPDVWGLSARRAGAVRAAIVALGAPTDLRARAYGDTLPLASGEGEEQQSRNRRVEFRCFTPQRPAGARGPEFMIRERDDSGGQPVGSVTAAAARRTVRHSARPVTVAGMVRYEMPGAVSIDEGTTTMVTMINRDTRGRDVYLYRPDDNVPGSDRYPQRAAMIENSGKLTLEPGPVAIFARGTFVGEGLLDRLHPGQTAYIPYAVDSSTTIRTSDDTFEKPSRLISIVDGEVTVENYMERVTRYEVETGTEPPDLLVVKHGRTAGHDPVGLPADTRTTPDALLIPMPLTAKRTAVLTVRERQPVRRTIWLREGGAAQQLGLYLQLQGGAALSPAQAAQLKQIVKTHRKVAGLRTRIDQLRERITDQGVRGGELRESIKAVNRTAGAAGLRRRLLRQIGEGVSQMEQLTRELTAASLDYSQARDDLKRQILGLRIGAKKKDE